MPPLSGFSDNSFQSRDDVLRAAISLLEALQPYKSPCGARIKLPTATGTGFDETAAQLEGFARPLWVVADLLAIGAGTAESDLKTSHLDLNSWVRGLAAGTDPNSDTYWGQVGNHDQRMVEMEPIAYGLLAAPSAFLPAPSDSSSGLDPNHHRNDMIVAWLRSINDREVPPSNWRWFRVLVNLALVKSFGVPYHEVKPFMDTDFEVLDSFYLGNGWSSDGLWCADKKQTDYYSGSFAIQYSQLAYVRFAHDIDPERVQKYCTEAREFAATFWRYFDVNGAAIPFGRSLTYRFTFAAFWSAVAVSGISLPSPVNHLGTVKGLLMRHLRWWAAQGDIFNTDGTLNIGYTYPNMYMSEDYNSPQSVYWCLKSFSILGLPKEHPFWACEELPHPLMYLHSLSPVHKMKGEMAVPASDLIKFDPLFVNRPAMQIICSSQEHHFLLSAGQFTRKTHRAREAKYGKFAYSSYFAFSVPTGTLLSQMAPDSTLSISNDGGETWKVRWEPIDARVKMVKLSLQPIGNSDGQIIILPTLISRWKPWKSYEIYVETTLIPPLERWGGWHFRMHKLTWGSRQVYPSIQLVDAGFAISSQRASATNLPQLNSRLRVNKDRDEDHTDEISPEGIWQGQSGCLILSKGGASGISELSTNIGSLDTICKPPKSSHRGCVLKPDANTNLVVQRTVVPTIHHQFNISDMSDAGELCFVTGVFAISSTQFSPARLSQLWQDKPSLIVEGYVDAF